jgi:WD40 repeat protein/serine/threonine protein kinase
MDAPLKNIKGYEIRERIGTGGFGAVYKAYQTTIGREVAIKVILPDRANQPDFIRRFENEAQLVARLEHPHIVPLYDYWRDPDGAYLVMRWLRGGSLRDALATGVFELRAILLLLDQIAGALALAHRGGIIHRDIKPGNILLDEDGNAYLTDFGIAKDLSLPKGTASDVLVGSLDYISPEQARSESVTPRTDIYSLGVTLYELITGQHPFAGISSVERLYKHINDPLPLITGLDAGVQAAVNAVIQKATAKNPEHRHADVLALAADFRNALGAGAATVTIEAQLTQREHEILRLIVDGLANKEIAQRLTLTLGTVKWHVNQIYGKLGVRSRVQAIIRARELELLSKGGADGATVLIPTTDFNPANPYKGLLAFQSADSQDFYGREKITAILIRRLNEIGLYTRFLAVVGPSGSGKSSLVKAGLIPALWRGELPGSERWFVAEMLPGTHPLDELEVALMRIAANQAGNLHEHLRRDERGLVRCASLILPNDGTELVLVIDQFEEVYTLASDEQERAHFLALLCAAVTDARSRVRVIITLRADFYDRPLHDPQFGDLVRTRLETIMPLSAEELERAIVRPAERAGVTFEPGLVATIIGDVNYQPGALPLLQFALTELFERRQGRLLTRAAYEAIGGTTGALAKRAETVYLGFAEREREIARQIFLRLVTLGEGTEDTRRRATRSEFKAIAGDSDVLDDILDTLAAYRLLALDTDPATRTPTVELAHEALLREWERLRAWLNEARDDIKTQRQLTVMAQEWRAADHDASFLARGSRLAQFEEWRGETTLRLSQVEREYLDASLTQRQRDMEAEDARQAREQTLERRSRTFLRGLVGVLLLATLGAFGLTAFALDREAQAQDARAEAVNAQATSEANFAQAEQQRLYLAADNAMDDNAPGNVGLALALDSLAYGYSAGADAAILRASRQGFIHKTLVGHQLDINSVAYSPDGRWIAASSEGGTRIYYAETGEEVQFLAQDTVTVAVNFSSDGQHLLTTSFMDVQMWDTATWTIILTLPNDDFVFYAGFTPDDQQFMVLGETVYRVFDALTGELVTTYQRERDDGVRLRLLIYHPQTPLRFLLTDPEGKTFLQNAENGVETCTLIEPDSTDWVALHWSYNSPFGVVTTRDRRAMGWNLQTCTLLSTFSGHGAEIHAVDYHVEEGFVVTGDDSGEAFMWDLQSGREMGRYHVNTRILSLDISPDGNSLALPDFAVVPIWDLNFPAEPQPLDTDQFDQTYFTRFAPDGETLYIGGFGTFSRWSLENPQTPIIRYPHIIRSLDVSPTGERAVIAIEEGDIFDYSLYMMDVESGEISKQFEGHTAAVNIMDFSPDGRQIVSSSFDMTARIWDVATGAALHILEGHEGVVSCADFSPDGSMVATTSTDGSVRLWDVASGEIVRVITIGAPTPFVAFSPDGSWIATSDDTGNGYLIDVATGEISLRLVGHTDLIWSSQFSPDGSHVVTASWDGTARIWDVMTGETVRVLDNGLDHPLFYAEYSPDGETIVTSGEQDDHVYLWRVDLNAVIASLCARPLQDLTPEERTQYGITDDAPICPPP